MKDKTLKDKIIWITGASSGIGLSLINELLNSDSILIASARSLSGLEALKVKYSTRLYLVEVDVTSTDSVKKATDEIKMKFGRVDIAILNAGTCKYVDMPNFSSQVIKENFDTNLYGVANCIEFVLPLLKESKSPYLVGMSSSSAYLPLPRAEGYGASKSAINYLFKTLRVSLSRYNIDVTIICPGFVKTPLSDLNDFPMPFLITSEKSSQIIVEGLKKRKLEISFPKRLIVLLKFVNVLPSFLKVKILKKLIN